ncbi:MAG: hypothetical protein JJ895_07695 [Balneolaceae bacterium]|nr:hypothetical protein [Balneolaceae bacterium]
MHYPIFKSIVNTVQTQLGKRGIESNKFKTWEDSKINAIGLELEVGLSNDSSFVDALSINFDWDSFRETQVARKLEGMHEHPFLKIEKLSEVEVSPTIDVEMTWVFDIEACQPQQNGKEGNYRIEQASKWMESISKQINDLLKNENLITRWHIEIEGDEHGKYLSAINLISYFQYELSAARDLNDLQKHVARRLQELLLRGNRVISMADSILKETVAA